MRILLATHFFPPGHIGGTETLSVAIASGMLKRGHQVQVICAENWDTAPSYKIVATDDIFQNIPVRRIHINWKRAPDVFRYLYNNPEIETYFRTVLKEYQPDIVHITSCYTLSASIISASHYAGIPIILTATDFWFLCARNTLLTHDGELCTGPESVWKCARCKLGEAKAYRWPHKILPDSLLEPLILQIGKYPQLTRQHGLRGMLGNWEDRFSFLQQSIGRVNLIITASHHLKALFEKFGTPPHKIRFSPYGFDTSWALVHQNKTHTDELRLGYIGQIIPMKGVDILIKAVKEIDPGVSISLKIYGSLEKDRAYGKELIALAESDSRIQFVGTFPYDRIGEVLDGIDVLVVPSIWYDFPLIIPSAYATRTPVIATRLAGMSDLVQDEIDGLLFNRSDVTDLRRQILRVATDKSLLDTLRQGISPVKTVEEMAEEYDGFYHMLLNKLEDTSD